MGNRDIVDDDMMKWHTYKKKTPHSTKHSIIQKGVEIVNISF